MWDKKLFQEPKKKIPQLPLFEKPQFSFNPNASTFVPQRDQTQKLAHGIFRWSDEYRRKRLYSFLKSLPISILGEFLDLIIKFCQREIDWSARVCGKWKSQQKDQRVIVDNVDGNLCLRLFCDGDEKMKGNIIEKDNTLVVTWDGFQQEYGRLIKKFSTHAILVWSCEGKMYKWESMISKAFPVDEVLHNVSLTQYVNIFKEEGYSLLPHPQSNEAEFSAMIEDTGMDEGSAKLLYEWMLMYIKKKRNLSSSPHSNSDNEPTTNNEGDEADGKIHDEGDEGDEGDKDIDGVYVNSKS